MSPARVFVRRPSGAVDHFIAEHCEIHDGLVTATGQVRRPSGRLEPRRSYTWPRSRIVEIRWTAVEAMAA